VESGKVRYVGASNYAGWQLMKALSVADRINVSRFVSQQIYYSLQARDAETELVPVSIEGTRAEMLAADLNSLAKTPSGVSVQLLPLFDPYLMGYANRDHLYAAIYRSRISRTAGWISAVVLVDGRVAGTWSHVAAKKNLHIKIDPFQRLAPKILVEVKRRAASLAETLGLARAEVTIA